MLTENQIKRHREKRLNEMSYQKGLLEDYSGKELLERLHKEFSNMGLYWKIYQEYDKLKTLYPLK